MAQERRAPIQLAQSDGHDQGQLGDVILLYKVLTKFAGCQAGDVEHTNFRAVPGAIGQRLALLAQGARCSCPTSSILATLSATTP